ncbi:MAG TPA: ferric reductase-like transmembrane domain-containing protein, partial [Ktedonobacterales bacterium]|nr:ferric reductase-like transmembrane domain-containing protein [Ktedonobacterales bacterium]
MLGDHMRLRLIVFIPTLGLACLGALIALSPVHANATDGVFQIALTGQVSSSQIQGDPNGNHVVTVSQQLQTVAGQYPDVTLQLDFTETLDASHAGRLTGTFTLSDPTEQTTIFTGAISGALQSNGSATYHLSSPHAAAGSGGALTWQGNFAAAKQGAINGNASGVLKLPTGISAQTANAIWPGAANTAAPSDPTLWYLTRGAASAAYVVLVVTTALGIGISTQAFDSVMQRWRVLDLHQVLTLLMLGLVALHLVTVLLDPFISYNVANLLWPFDEPGRYRPLYVSLGVVGLYTLAVVTISSWVRRWLAYGVWRALHYV